MDNLKEICLICGDMTLARSSLPSNDLITSEDELRDLRFFLCKVLSIPLSCFEYCGFPFCQKCTTTRVKELMRIHNHLLPLQISYASLKQNLLRDIVTVYVRQNSDNWISEGNGLTGIIIKKWTNYIADSGFSSFKYDENFKNEIVEFSESEIKDEFCDLSENSIPDENYLEELEEPLTTSTSANLFPDRNANILDFKDNAPTSLVNNPEQRKSRVTRLNYCEFTDTLEDICKDDDENIRKTNNRKGSKIIASSTAQFPHSTMKKKVQPRYAGKLWKCPYCPQEVRGTDRLQVHMRTHTNERPYVCSECNQAFRQPAHLQTHKKVRHGYQGKTKTVEGLNSIESKHRIYHCAFCSATRKTKGFYIRHLMFAHKGEQIQEGDSVSFYYCDAKECLVACADQEQLKEHFVQSHKDLLSEGCLEFPKCDICQRIFTMQETLEMHKMCHPTKINEKQSKFPCDYCCHVFNTKTEMNDHLPRHSVPCGSSKIFSHLCDLCGKGYSELSTLLFHKRKVHFQNKIIPKPPTQSRTYFCGLCDNQLKSKKSFVLHLNEVHSQEINDGDSFWFYNCDIQECLASYLKPEELKRHFEENHKTLININGSEFPSCEICQRVFALQESLDIHRKSHNSESQLFSCDYCHLCYLSKAVLTRHLSKHTFQFHSSESHHVYEFGGEGEASVLKQHAKKLHKGRKRKCPVCEEVLLEASMFIHMRKHKNPNGFSCPHCPHIASTTTSLQLHLEKIHPSNNSPAKFLKNNCQYCEKRFYMSSEVHKHSIIHHATEYLNSKSFCCSCYKTFNTEEEMEEHFKAQHPHLICSVEECGKKFNNPTRLSLHMNTHNKEKPFICEYCQRGFSQSGSLQFHINTKHTFHRSFLCKLCPDNPGYYERRTFNKHLESDHPTCAVKDILITDYPKRKYFFC